ncbi:MAG: SRPBCC domain-containing protein [Actinobacteria bacterium]|nr:SRPBCC domain-containing protein [Actinomycetota bacterium]
MAERADGLMLHLERVLPASPARVFAAMTEPAELAQWWGPRGFSSPNLELDVRVGGAYRIAMQPPEGDLFHLRGEFREVEPPTRLSYTFIWEEPDPDDQETVVAIVLRDRGPSTELLLDQGPFATEARRALHDAGWMDGLDKLEAQVARGA